MAYTYDDFASAATKAGLLDKFSAADLETAKRSPEFGLSILSLMQDSANATTGEQKLLADEAANQLRKTYGSYTQDSTGSTAYSGYGAKINELMGKVENYGGFSYDNSEAYNKLLEAVTNPEAFSYDPETDPVFSSYKKTYLREGERAAADTLAKAAAATGGIPSSYAVGAAQQAANYYTAGLSDIIPTLYQDAYSKYLNDFSMKQSSLAALESDRNFDYQDWMNGFNMLQTALGNYQTQDATEYSKYLNMLDQINTQNQQKISNALALYQALGYATPEVAAILGIEAGKTTGGGSGGISSGSGSSGSGVDNGTLTDAKVVELQQMANALGKYNLAEDGKYGAKSQAAIAELLGGSYGADDAYRILKGLYANTINQQNQTDNDYGFTAEEVKSLQRSARIPVTGKWDDNTQKAYNAGYRPTDSVNSVGGVSGGSYYSKVLDAINNLKSVGRDGEIEGYLKDVEKYLTPKEYKQLCDQYGVGK